MSTGSPLISVSALTALAERPSLLDIRWTLAGPPGREEYERGHIPGAVYVDLDSELAAPPGAGGRHPLPAADAFGAAMRAAGVSQRRAVVVYDAGTSMAAARAWWLLRYFGHPDAAVLDGGLAAWVAAGGRLETAATTPAPGDFTPRPGGMPVVDARGAAAIAREGVLLDARGSERYRGESEPIDPVAGHIPGARSWPATDNIELDGRFRPAAELRGEFERLGVADRIGVGAYCGSGVAAAHEVLALELAGFASALYPGSWSEWILDRDRPVATG
jgi:thiosulfate/3-mercaptopyruvate sulfurtransferase